MKRTRPIEKEFRTGNGKIKSVSAACRVLEDEEADFKKPYG